MSCSSHKFEVGDNVIINIYRQNHNEILNKYGIDYKMLCDKKDTPRTMYNHRSGKITDISDIHTSTGRHTVYKLNITYETCFLPEELTCITKQDCLVHELEAGDRIQIKYTTTTEKQFQEQMSRCRISDPHSKEAIVSIKRGLQNSIQVIDSVHHMRTVDNQTIKMYWLVEYPSVYFCREELEHIDDRISEIQKGSDQKTQCNMPISSTGIYIPSMPDPIVNTPKGKSNTDTEDGLMMCTWRPVVPIQVETPSESIDSAVSLMNTYCIIIDGVYINA